MERFPGFNLTYDFAHRKYIEGLLSQEDWEHYMYHWRSETVRISSIGLEFQCDKCPVCGQVF